MARFERSRERKRKDRDSSPRRDDRRRSFKDSPSDRRSSGKEFNRNSRGPNSRDRHEFKMTKVICSSCGDECEVPFKPTSNKPVYCSDCFKKKGGSDRSSNLDVINEKLNKIMKALKIE